MARNSRTNPRWDVSGYAPGEDVIPKPVQIGGFRGMDTKSPLVAMNPESMRLIRNLAMRYNAFAPRDGTSAIGTISPTELLYAGDFFTTDGKNHLVRWRLDGVDEYINGVWTAAVGDAWSGERYAPFAITGWADFVLFTAGDGRKIFQLEFLPVPTLTELTDSPVGVRHLTTFNSRVIASDEESVIWSVKDDHTDWTGLGSGFEDLRSAPGGKIDQQTAVVPVTDETAYCIRTNSVWQMGNTGDFDAPFAFTRLLTYVGSRWPATVVSIPRGVICLGDAGQIWKIEGSQFVDIAVPIHDEVNSMMEAQKKLCSAAYDLKFNEFRMVRPDENSLTAQKVLRYNLDLNAWTEDVYPFPIRSISYTQFAKKLTIDELPGTIDSLIGTIDDLGVGIRNPGAVYAMARDSRWVVRDDSLKNNDPERDVNFAGARAASGFRVESGDVKVGDPIKRQQFNELLCWYEADVDALLVFDYSYDGGVIWDVASELVAVATTRPRAVKVVRTADRDHMQFALSCEAVPNMRIISFQAVMTDGARSVDVTP